MLRYFVGTLLLLACAAVPQGVRAADTYANTVTSASSNVLTPENALGAPDGAYADFRATNAALTLDLGEGEEGEGDLTLSVYLLNYGAAYYVTFYDGDGAVLTSSGATFAVGSTTAIAAYDGVVPYRYVRIASMNGLEWRLDAVAIPASVSDVAPIVEPVGTGAEPPAASYLQGTLVKSETNSAVYILGIDGKRHAFPTEREFTSWGLSFDDVETVDDRTLAAYALDGNVTVRPGTYLVKLQTNPKVFAVEPGGVLRWVSTEALALQLYGADWASRVIDVSDAFWANYTVGAAIDSAVHPDGTVLVRGGSYYYVADASKAVLRADDIAALRLDPTFAVTPNATIFGQYVDTVPELLVNEATWPY